MADRLAAIFDANLDLYNTINLGDDDNNDDGSDDDDDDDDDGHDNINVGDDDSTSDGSDDENDASTCYGMDGVEDEDDIEDDDGISDFHFNQPQDLTNIIETLNDNAPGMYTGPRGGDYYTIMHYIVGTCISTDDGESMDTSPPYVPTTTVTGTCMCTCTCTVYSKLYTLAVISTPKPWTGFKIVGDNIDKTVNPSFQRLLYPVQSLHYFHSYACLDRIDFSNLDDSSPIGVINVRKACFASTSEILELKSNFCVLVSRYN